MWHSPCYSLGMASRVVRARLDPPSELSLELLMREGLNESEAVRAALVEAGQTARRRSALAEEAGRLAADDADRAALARVQADMDAVAAEWPA